MFSKCRYFISVITILIIHYRLSVFCLLHPLYVHPLHPLPLHLHHHRLTSPCWKPALALRALTLVHIQPTSTPTTTTTSHKWWRPENWIALSAQWLIDLLLLSWTLPQVMMGISPWLWMES